MQGEILFTMKDPENRYTPLQVLVLLQEAERGGHPIEKGIYLEGMTIRQLDALLHGKADA